MRTIAIPMYSTDEHPARRPRGQRPNGGWVLEAYFLVMTVLILGLTVGLVAYTVLTVIPEWQRSHSRERLQNYYWGPQISHFR